MVTPRSKRYLRTRAIVRATWMIAVLPVAYAIGYVWN